MATSHHSRWALQDNPDLSHDGFQGKLLPSATDGENALDSTRPSPWSTNRQFRPLPGLGISRHVIIAESSWGRRKSGNARLCSPHNHKPSSVCDIVALRTSILHRSVANVNNDKLAIWMCHHSLVPHKWLNGCSRQNRQGETMKPIRTKSFFCRLPWHERAIKVFRSENFQILLSSLLEFGPTCSS
mmetsp:Transcript_9391/g.19213  ORF Transcript_9391/g.19213 Transcript_9391/m.19213 type:complete len:186 (+) Transcript_9391:461-1018(+)